MNEFYERLDALYSAGNQEAVESFMKEALAETGEFSLERAVLLNELAGYYRGVSRYAESEEAFEKSLSIFEAAGMVASPEYATVLMNLAGLYRIKGKTDKAADLFIAALGKLDESGGRDTYVYVSVLNNLSLAYQAKGEPSMALEYAARALDLMRSGIGNEHEIATSLNNLASIRLGLGEIDAAETLVTEALEIFDAMADPDVHHAAALTTKSVVMCRKGDHSGSLAGFRRALELTRRFFGENIEFAVCRRNISEVCESLGDIPSAITELTDAIRVMERILGPGDSSVHETKKRLERLMQPADARE